MITSLKITNILFNFTERIVDINEFLLQFFLTLSILNLFYINLLYISIFVYVNHLYVNLSIYIRFFKYISINLSIYNQI